MIKNNFNFKREELEIFNTLFSLLDDKKPKKILFVCANMYAGFEDDSTERNEILDMFCKVIRLVESVDGMVLVDENRSVDKYHEISKEIVSETLENLPALSQSVRSHFKNLTEALWSTCRCKLAEKNKFRAYLMTNGLKFSKYFNRLKPC